MNDSHATVLVDLDVCVLNALKLFIRQGLPSLSLGNFARPLVVGSGNAATTGRILLQDRDAVFADESTYQNALKAIKSIDGAILISASGGKHAPIIAKDLKDRGLETRLLTCNPNAPAKKYVDQNKVFIFPHQPEPYTYNTSTYMSMILAKTKEDPQEVFDHIENAVNQSFSTLAAPLRDFEAFYFIVPEKFDCIRQMLTTKFVELFARRIARDIFTSEQAKHATTLMPADHELFVSLGYENKLWGRHRLDIPLPENADYGAIMAVGYYVIGKIQAAKPPWFKQNVAHYCEAAAKWFGKELPTMVEYK
jgi:hypothetical protein